MIISYLSISDRNEYIRITKYILQSNGIRFHIKSLVISLLSNVETPFNDEKQIALKLILQKKKYYDIFIDSLISKGWTNWLIQQGLLKNMYELKPTIRDSSLKRKQNILSGFYVVHFITITCHLKRGKISRSIWQHSSSKKFAVKY